LDEFKEKTDTGNKDDLHRELLEIDRKAKVKKQATSWLEGDTNTQESADEKRMHMYKNMRDELLREESKTKSDN